MTGPHQNPVLDIGEPPCTDGGVKCPLFAECKARATECTAFRCWARNRVWFDEEIGSDLKTRRVQPNER